MICPWRVYRRMWDVHTWDVHTRRVSFSKLIRFVPNFCTFLCIFYFFCLVLPFSERIAPLPSCHRICPNMYFLSWNMNSWTARLCISLVLRKKKSEKEKKIKPSYSSYLYFLLVLWVLVQVSLEALFHFESHLVKIEKRVLLYFIHK